jgi:hypothetical protein
LEIRAHVLTGTTLYCDPAAYTSKIAGITGAYYHTRLFVMAGLKPQSSRSLLPK